MRIVTAAEMSRLDKEAATYGVGSLLLMEQAAKQTADAAMSLLGDDRKKAVIFCGKGNNGGDGLGAGRHLLNYGIKARAFLVGAQPEELSDDAKAQLTMFVACGGTAEKIVSEDDLLIAQMAAAKADLLIDALLGTGFKGGLDGLLAQVCTLINKAERPVLSIDIPSGVNADDGSADKAAVKADHTVTMGLVKQGLLLYPARAHVGKLLLAYVGHPEQQAAALPVKKQLVTQKLAADLIPQREGNAHKGSAGRVVILAGSPGYSGAAALCAQAAVKSGAGFVHLLTPAASRDVLAWKLTEVMVQGLLEKMPGVLGGAAAAAVLKRCEGAQVLALGPGLGLGEGTQEAVREVLLKSQVPCVIDADALTALTGHIEVLQQMTAPKVLTPHPGELGRLLGIDAKEADRRRMELAPACAQNWQATVVLKGAPTVIAGPEGTVYVNGSGGPNMASGGSGDVLTGFIAGLIAQGSACEEAAVAAVYLHGRCGERANGGAVGLAAGELCGLFPAVRRETEQGAERCCAGIINCGLLSV